MAKAITKGAANPQEDLDTKRRSTIYLTLRKIKQIKHIAYNDDISQTDIIDNALEEYIKKWEQKNGPIQKK